VRRPAVITALVFGGFVFLGISVLLARGLGATGTERARVLELLEVQARGDTNGVLAKLPQCRVEPACVATVRARAASLVRPGAVEILNFQPSVRLALTDQTGLARVAWRGGTSLPVVQCVRVERSSALAGGDVRLIAISGPIGLEASCR
jgi:hypothetical protein